MAVVNSELMRRLNVVKIYYTDSEGKHVSLFESEDSPLYLMSEIPDISFNIDTKTAWDNTHNLFSNALTQNVVSTVLDKTGLVNDFSGCLDLRSKFAFMGSSPLEFSGIKCMLINSEGWDKSIAPTLNKLVDWILPEYHKAADGQDYVVGKELREKWHEQEGSIKTPVDTEDGAWSEALNSLYSLLGKGLDMLGDWVGDVKFLNLPKQYDVLNVSANHAYLAIGPSSGKKARFEIPDVYISSASIQIPKSYMLNSNGEPEPDHVEITLGLKTIRQTTKSMITF